MMKSFVPTRTPISCVVYDASAQAEKSLPSLNECLYAGPSMAPLVFDGLLRFRAYRADLTLTGGIEALSDSLETLCNYVKLLTPLKRLKTYARVCVVFFGCFLVLFRLFLLFD